MEANNFSIVNFQSLLRSYYNAAVFLGSSIHFSIIMSPVTHFVVTKFNHFRTKHNSLLSKILNKYPSF